MTLRPYRPVDMIFPGGAAAKAANKCPVCRSDIREGEFTSELSIREFNISGLCQKCQDFVFAAPEED